jgi:hypothetical protein
MTDLEHTIATSVDKIRVVQGGPAGDGSEIARTLGQMAQAVATGDSQVLIRLMCDLIPEAVPPLSERRVEPPSPRRSGTIDVKETKVGETSISPEPATLP